MELETYSNRVSWFGWAVLFGVRRSLKKNLETSTYSTREKTCSSHSDMNRMIFVNRVNFDKLNKTTEVSRGGQQR
jgi:hypothetical protein